MLFDIVSNYTPVVIFFKSLMVFTGSELLNTKLPATSMSAPATLSFLAFLDGSCRSPISSSAYIKDNNNLTLYGSIAKIDGTEVINSSITGSVSDAVLLGQELGKEIISKGGNKIL